MFRDLNIRTQLLNGIASGKGRLVIVAAAPVVFCFFQIGDQCLDFDERHNVGIAMLTNFEILTAHISGQDLNTPIYSFLLHFVVNSLGKDEGWLRFISAFSGVVIVWTTYLIGLRLFSSKTAFTAAFLLSISAFHVYHSQYTRPHALGTMFMIQSIYHFLVFHRTNKLGDLVNHLIFSLIGFYTLVFTGLVVIFLNIYVFVLYCKGDWKPVKKWIAGQIVLILLFLPWLLPSLLHLSILDKTPRSYSLNAYLLGIPAVFLQFSLGLTMVREFLGGNVVLRELIIVCLSSISFATPTCLFLFKLHENKRYIFVLLWLTIPIAVLYLAWTLQSFVFEARYMLISLPAYFLVIALGLENLNKLLSRLLLFLIVTFNIMSQFNHHFVDRYRRQPLRAVVEHIEEHSTDDDIVLYSTYATFQYYNQGRKLESFVMDSRNLYLGLLERLENPRNIWLIEQHSHHPPLPKEFQDWMEHNYILEDHIEFPGLYAIDLFSYTKSNDAGRQ